MRHGIIAASRANMPRAGRPRAGTRLGEEAAGARGERIMAERLGLAIIPGTGWPAREIQTIAREAEDAGFDAIFTTEVNNDALATAQLMGTATRRIQVGTWIANIYLRHAYVCAQGAALIADATGGRFVLGLGVSHQPINRALGIDMPHPSE